MIDNLFYKIIVNTSLSKIDKIKNSNNFKNDEFILYYIVGYFLYNELYSTTEEKNHLEKLLDLIQINNDSICNIREYIETYVSFDNGINVGDNNNSAPIITNTSITGDFPISFNESMFSKSFSDNENDLPSKIKITSVPSFGTLSFGKNIVNINDTFYLRDIWLMTYYQNIHSDTDYFSYRINDNNSNPLYSNMATCTINISNPINQPPSSTGELVINNTMGSYHIFTFDNFTTETSPQYNDPEGDQAYAIKITSLPSKGVLKISNSSITNQNVFLNQKILLSDISIGSLSYKSNVIENGQATTDSFTFSISDVGSKEFRIGGSVVINISGYINQPATVSDSIIDVNEGELLIISRNLLTEDYSDPEGDLPLKIKITSLPSNGVLKLNNVDVSVNDEIMFVNIDNNELIFSQDSGMGGTSVDFTFLIQDSGSGQYQ